jgi:hypothetical protein
MAIGSALEKAVGGATAERPLGAVQSDCEQHFVAWRLPEPFRFDTDSLLPFIEQAIEAVKRDSSPGYPLRRYTVTNDQAISAYRREIVEAVAARLILLSSAEANDLSPAALVRAGYRDLVSPFIKNELHPPRKARSGKWRIVQCVSLVDQLVERVLYSLPVMALKIRYPRSDAVVGIGFTDHMTSEFYDVVMSDMTKDACATDVSGWDTTVGASYIREASEALIRSCTNPTEEWARAVRGHVHGLLNPAFLVPVKGGFEVVSRNRPGGMLSGSFLTTTFNTLARLDVSRLAGSVRCKAAGDDAIELFPPGVDPVEAYRALGFKLRLEPRDDGFVFCSHLYPHLSPDKAPLLSWRKAVANFLLLGKPSPEQKVALRHELRHNPELKWIDSLIDETTQTDGPATGTVADKI